MRLTASIQDDFKLLEPDAIPFEPAGPGWLILAVGIVAFIAILLLYWRYLRLKNAYRKAAVKALDGAEHLTNAAHIQVLHLQLKSTAMHVFGRAAVASLEGDQWRRFLNSKTKYPLFEEGLFQRFEAARYSGQLTTEDMHQMHQNTINWLTHHDI